MLNLLRDVRYGFRMLLRTPAISALAVLALALGIGANSAIFSMVYALLLRPMTVRDPGSLVALRAYNPKFDIPDIDAGSGTYFAWRRRATSFDSMAASWSGTAQVAAGGPAEKMAWWRVSASFFPVLGIAPGWGRGFVPEEDRPGAPHVALIADDLWRTRFGARADIAGQTVTIESVPYTIVGVMPPGFRIDGKPAAVYSPLALDPQDRRMWLGVMVYGRLKPGIGVAQAQSEMDAVARAMDERGSGWRAHVALLRHALAGDVRLSLLVLLGAVSMVLLLACANIATLLLARSGTRRREIAIRASLGAPRRRLLAQLLTESVLLAVLGGALGLVLAAWCAHAVRLIQNVRLPNLLLATRIDGAVLGFTAAVSVATGLLFGVIPALTGTAGGETHAALQSGGRAGDRRKRLWDSLVIVETAVALTLLIGATLLTRSFLYLRDTAPGFRVDGLSAASISPAKGRYTTPESLLGLYASVLERVRAVPGVRAATLASCLPLDGDFRAMSLPLEGHTYARPQDLPILWFRQVDAAYFRTLQIPLRRGRLFTPQDREGAPRVVLINESMARRYWPNADPLGRHIGASGRDFYEIVGVVADVRHQNATKEGLIEVFFPYLQNPPPSMSLAIRAEGRVRRDVERAVAAIDPTLTPLRFQDMLQVASDRLAAKRLTALVIAAFAGLALLLAVIGVYGVLSFTVSSRTHEIGVRLAIGAPRASVVRDVVVRAVVLALIGIAIGVTVSLAFGRVLKSLLYGVTATDPAIFAGASAALLAIAALASYLPARRAGAIDPAVALRHE